MKEYYEQTAAMYGMELEAFLEAAMGTTVEEFEKEAIKAEMEVQLKSLVG